MNSYRDIMNFQKKYEYESDEQRRVAEMQRNSNKNSDSGYNCPNPTVQTHTHEFESSTKLAEEGDDRHNHRFAGVSSEVIPISGKNHKHTIFTLTDFFGHLHEVTIETGPAIDVGHGKHVHFASGETTLNDGHLHEYAFNTLIEAPLLPNT
jgi:hypothetical protein